MVEIKNSGETDLCFERVVDYLDKPEPRDETQFHVSSLVNEAARMNDRTLVDKILNGLFSTAAGTKAVQTYTGNNNNGN